MPLRVVLDGGHQLGLRLLGGQAGDALEGVLVVGLGFGQRPALRLELSLHHVEMASLLLQRPVVGVQPLLPIGETLLPPLDLQPLVAQLVAALAGLFLDVATRPFEGLDLRLGLGPHLAGVRLGVSSDLEGGIFGLLQPQVRARVDQR